MTQKKGKRPNNKRKQTKNHKRKVREKKFARPSGGFNKSQIMTMIHNSGFLKCALAPIDFDTTGFRGVPDTFSGKVFSEHWSSNSTLSVAAGYRSMILLLPTVGTRYLVVTGPRDAVHWKTISWNPLYYPDMTELFPTGDEASPRVAEGRMVSNCIELTNVSPIVNRGGSVKTCRIAAEVALAPLPGQTNSFEDTTAAIFGIAGWPEEEPNEDVTVTDASKGCYMQLENTAGTWPWTVPKTTRYEDLYDGTAYAFSWEAHDNASGVTQNTITNGFFSKSRIWDNNFNSKVMIIDAPASAGQDFIIKSKQCVSFRPVNNTLENRIAQDSAHHSPLELNIYNECIKQMPVSVIRSQNDNFWGKVKKFMGQAVNVLEKAAAIGGAVALVL